MSDGRGGDLGATYRDRSRIFRFTCFARASCTLAEYVSTRSPVVCKAGREIWHARGLAGAGFTEGGGTPASWPPRTRVIRDHAYVAHGGGLDVFRVGADLALERLGRTALGGAAIDVDVDAEATARSLRLLTHPTASRCRRDGSPSRPAVWSLRLPASAPTSPGRSTWRSR